MDDALAELHDILSAYAVTDVAVPFYGFATSHIPVTHANVRATMRGEFMRQDSPEHWREDALKRVHEMLADLEGHLWVRTDAADIRFWGQIVQYATVTLDGKLVTPPVESMLSCEVSVELDRLTGRLGDPASAGART